MAAQQPTYQAYTVVKREGQDDFWLNIGAAWMHQDGDGYKIVLQALPIADAHERRAVFIVRTLAQIPDDNSRTTQNRHLVDVGGASNLRRLTVQVLAETT